MALVAVLIAPSLSAFANPSLNDDDDHHNEEHDENSEKKALWEIEDIMETTHKGKVSVVKKVIAGEATEAEIKLLLEQYLTLERLTPPQGELDVWKKKTAALTKATAGVVAGVEGSRDALKEAVNCKACHKTYKPD